MKNKNIALYLLSMILILIGLIFISLTLKNEKEMVEEDEITTTTAVETTTSPVVDFTVEDRTRTCAQAIEVIYEDDSYRYTLSCMKSGTIYLVYEDGTEVTLRNAISSGMVTIDQLKASNLSMNIEPK